MVCCRDDHVYRDIAVLPECSARHVDHLSEIVSRQGEGGMVVVIELGVGLVTSVGDIAALSQLLAPAPAIIGVCAARSEAAAEIVIAARGGMTQLLFQGVDTLTREVGAVVALLRHELALRPVLQDVMRSVPPAAAPFLDACMRQMTRGPNVALVAQNCECSPRTLQRQCERLGLPHPAITVSWLRALSVARTLEHSPMNATAACQAYGFPTAKALRLLLRRHGVSIGDLRAPGSYNRLLERFRRELMRLRPQRVPEPSARSSREPVAGVRLSERGMGTQGA